MRTPTEAGPEGKDGGSAERWYAELFARSREGVFLAREGTLRFASASLARLLGYDAPDEMVSPRPLQIAALVDAADRDVLETAGDHAGPAEPKELWMRRRDGTKIRVQMVVQRVTDDDGVAWMEGFVQDLRPLHAEQENSRHLLDVIDAVEEAIFCTRPDGVVEIWNRGAESLFGYSAAEAVGRSTMELIVPEDRVAEERSSLARVCAGEALPPFETKRHHRSGARMDVAAGVYPIRDEEGEIDGVGFVVHDLTDRERDHDLRVALEREASAVRQMEESSRLRTDFIAEAAHELKGPLAPIMTHLQMASSSEHVSGSVRRTFDAMMRNARRLEALVGDLAVAARLQSDRQPIRRRSLDLRALAQEAVESVALFARARGVALEMQADGPVPVEGDPDLLRRAIEAALLSGVRFSPPDSTVSVRLESGSGTATLCVHDHGPGLAEEQMMKLFQPFAVFDEADPMAGTGLGLFIAKEAAERHGGCAWVEGEGPGQGMSLYLRLPTANSDGDARRDDARAEAA